MDPIALPLARYCLHFVSPTPVRFGDFPGSAWRGALGHALRRIACSTGLPVCPQCPEYRRCSYPLVFETPPPLGADRMRLYPTVPHPFVLDHEPADAPLKDARLRCRLMLTMIGDGDAHTDLTIRALQQAATGPKGIAGNRMKLEAVEWEQPTGSDHWEPWPSHRGQAAMPIPAPPAPRGVTIRLLTPLRVKRNGQKVGAKQFRFADLFINLMRRISSLCYFHAGHSLNADFRGLADRAAAVSAVGQLSWRDLDRYSSRQQTEMKMGGLVGTIRLEALDLTPFWPFLWLGQWTHAGTGATMGLGRYSLQANGTGPATEL